MNIKEALTSSIRRVFLDLTGVDDYYIFWTSSDNKLKLTSYVIAHKTSTLSTVEVNPLYLPDNNFVIRDPARLLKLLAISNENLSISLGATNSNKLILNDGVFDSEFVLCDSSTIGVRPPVIDEPLSYEIQIDINDEFYNRYISAKSANNTEIVSVEVKDRKIKLELGDNNNYSNKIKFFVETDGMFNMEKLLFSSDVIEEILKRNKGTQGKIYVCDQGLMKIEYIDSLKSTYFLVALDKL